jgi:hypothetical protein
MRYLKYFEGTINVDYNLIEYLEDVLLELNDKGFNTGVAAEWRDLQGHRTKYGGILINLDKIGHDRERTNYKYSNIEDCVEHIISYAESNGYTLDSISICVSESKHTSIVTRIIVSIDFDCGTEYFKENPDVILHGVTYIYLSKNNPNS